MGSPDRLVKGRERNLYAEYLTIPQAAKFLDRCDRTVRVYIKSGILRAHRIKGKGCLLWIRRDDLRVLKETREYGLGTGDLQDLLRTIKMRLHSIDHKLDFLMHVNGLDISILRDQPISMLIALYDECSDFLELNAHDIPPFQIENWAYMFMQFTELEFDRMVGPTLSTRPWEPFHDLCLHLSRTLRQKKGFASDQRLQELYRVLDKSRKSLNTAITVFVERQAAKTGGPSARRSLQLGQDDSLDRYIASEVL
ncbi:MAG: helix-turn-helix domain-containing protein [Candidatus Eisenbacteria sp.]|nr:helix-turn-helix domain-containing protein [Candidatus Eisenbacteria bacterium]